MTDEAIRSQWTALSERLDAEARGMKEAQAAVIELSERYAMLDAEARPVVDGLLIEWALSDDENQRFKALALISDHRIVSAVPACRELLARLVNSTTPGAPYEQAKIRRILARLENGAVA